MVIKEGSDHEMKKDNEKGVINPNCILWELRQSNKQNDDLSDEALLEVTNSNEKDFGPIIPSKLGVEYDTELAAGDFLHKKKKSNASKSTGSKPKCSCNRFRAS